jgi:hypothetical protein
MATLSRLILCIVVLSSALVGSAKTAPTFDREVMSVLAKAGCNMGTCHGNLNGKGGFKLSLRGADPSFDFRSITRGQSARRINSAEPDASLLLLKATMAVPHEGGKRFDATDPEYRLLRDWITAGAERTADVSPVKQLHVEPRDVVLTDPQQSIALRVAAEFQDGTRSDVGRLAVYEPAEPVVDVSKDGQITRRDFAQTVVVVRYLDQQVPVRVAFIPRRDDFVWSGPKPTNFVDEQIFDRLKQLRINPSAVCDDVTFLRRATLDLTGLLPTAAEARAFVADSRPDKRARLIEEIFERPAYADCWSQKWADLLRVEEKTLDRKGVETFHAWLRSSVAANKPVDEFVRELVNARGSSYSSPAANYYRAMRTTDMRAESTAQLFLGVRLQCARCHNHPFDQWTQDDYYGWGNLFARVDYEVLQNRRRDKNDSHEFDGEQIVWMKSSGDFAHPAGRVVPSRFLAADAKPVGKQRDRLEALATWLTGSKNRRFAEAQANRIWFHLMGKGLVHPIDDFRVTNPPSHPELMAALAREFVEHQFDAQHLIRTIMLSNTYQFAADANASNQSDEQGFSHAKPRRLSAEQLADAVSQALDEPVAFNGYPLGIRAGQIPGVHAVRMREQTPSHGDRFLSVFGKPPRLQACECERTADSTLAQAFELVSGSLMNELLGRPNNRIGRLMQAGRSDAEIIHQLYWATLSHPPRAEELAVASRLVNSSSDRRRAIEDLAWSLMNSNEFLLRK